MSIKIKKMMRVLSLLVMLFSFIPVQQTVLAAAPLPPVDMFQLPWEQGLAWVALDGFDNGSQRALNSPHNYLNGGAVDFAPHNNMIAGENTSNFWVTAAADGTIVETSSCHLKIAHANGWVSEYQHLAKIQVKLGDVVARNQKLAVIANATTQPVCAGSVDPSIPHLHFALRPNMVGAAFAGWTFNYSSFWNSTTFTKNGVTVGLFKPLLNTLNSVPTATPTIVPTSTSANLPTPTVISTSTAVGQATDTPVFTSTPPPSTATSTPPSGPYVSTSVDQANIQIGGTALVTVSLNNVPSTGYTSAEFTCAYVSSLLEVSDVVPASLFGANVVTAMNNPQSGVFIFAIAGSNGNKATTSGTAFTFNVKGLSSGQTALECTARVSTGDNVLTALPSVGTSLSILEALPTPTDTTVPSTIEPPTATPSITPFPSATPIPGWLTFTDVTYSFQFQYPPQGQIQADSNDANTRINDLPIAQPGTNLTHKFMDVLVGQNVTECKSLQVQDPGVTVTINGIPFLKQTGDQGAAGSFFQLVEYSTQRDGVCVNLEFVLQSHDPSSFPTPPPVYDYATETALFDQIVGTYMWLAVSPTATFTSTPAVTSTPAESPTPTFTSTPFDSPTPDTSPTVVTPTMTPTVSPTGMIIGKAIASKPVTISVYDSNNALIVSVPVSQDGSFAVTLSGGTYTVVASASGCLSTQGSFSVTSDFNSTLPTITLSAGDIDNNNIIDQFDAMTIGMSYNTADPVSADLNSDGVINVLDLELLARNYRMTGPIVWQ